MRARRRVLAAAAVAAAAAALIGGVIVASSGSNSPSVVVGASVNRLFNDQTNSTAQINGQLAALQATGAHLARSDALWEASEPTPPTAGVHHYDWQFDDTIAGSLAVHGLQWLPIIDYSAPWAQSVRGRDHSPPRSVADYASYAAALAGRYGIGGSFWRRHPELPAHPVATYEVWNEPDNAAFWSPKPDAPAYADLYLRTREAIHAVQPSSRVLVGGLAHAPSFITALLGASPDLRHQLDGVAIHPYGPTPEAVLANVRAARLTLNAQGLSGMPLYVTEFGWTTSPSGTFGYLPGRLRRHYISRTLAALGHLDCGIAAVVLYTWVSPERNPASAEDWFGVHSPGGGPTADSEAFTQGVRAATSPAATVDLCGG